MADITGARMSYAAALIASLSYGKPLHSDRLSRIDTRAHLNRVIRNVRALGRDMHSLPRTPRQAGAGTPSHPRVHSRDVLRVDDLLRLWVQVERDRVRGEHGQHWRVRVPAGIASGGLEGHGVYGKHLARRQFVGAPFLL